MRWCVVLLVLGAASLTSPQAQAEEAEGPSFRLTLRAGDVTDGPPGPAFGSVMYPQLGLSVYNPWLFLDVSTPMLVMLVDAIGGAVLFFGAGVDNGGPPLLNVLNGNSEIGWFTFYEFSGGPQVFHPMENLHIGFGAQLEYSMFSAFFDGQRLGGTILDLSAKASASLDLGTSDVALGVVLGNGFHDHDTWNPFLGASLEANLMFTEIIGLHVKGTGRARVLQFGAYEPKFAGVPREVVQGRSFHGVWALEIGPMIKFD